MLRSLLRDTSGAAMVEFTILAPFIFLLSFGMVDFGMLLWQFNAAAKATQAGARAAVVQTPVAEDLLNVSYNYLLIGESCLDGATGLANSTGGVDHCPSVQTVCTANAGNTGSCTNGYDFDNDAFVPIFDRMQAVFPRLQRQNVQIAYQTTGLGFVGRPNGLPMNVTVRIRCMTYEFFFVDALMGLAMPANSCAGFPPGIPVPSSMTMLTSEDMVTN